MVLECQCIHLLKGEWMSLPDHESAPIMFDSTYQIIPLRRGHLFIREGDETEHELFMNFKNNPETSLYLWDVDCSWTT